MGRVLIYFGRFALIFVGYVAASLAASAFLHVVLLGIEPSAVVGRHELLRPLLISVPGLGLIVSYFAFLPSVPAILMSEAFGWRDWLYHAVAGAVIAISSIFLLAGASAHASSPDYDEPSFWAIMVGAGIAGGLAYWLVAGRLAGKWRTRARPRVGESA
jgi:hypothetical protein